MSEGEVVKEFLIESNENLDRLDQDLVSLEGDPRNREVLASVFRTIHTIKGASGFLAFRQLERVTHTGESLLACLRDGQLDLTPAITSALLATVDAVRQMLAAIEISGSEGERDDGELISRLTQLLNARKLSGLTRNIGEILVGKGVTTRREVEEAIEQQSAGDPRHLGEILVEKGAVTPQDVVEALQTQQKARMQGASESTIRVEVEQLDGLMDGVGELVDVRNRIVQRTNFLHDNELLAATQRLIALTSRLQEIVTRTRMQRIGDLWAKFPRIVRDLAVRCGKQARVAMEGRETELDRRILEAIKDPLTHLVRNALDHGIEEKETRLAAGKNPEGLVALRAFHQSGQVKIEISDDGRGLDLQKIRQKAIEKTLVTLEQAGRMGERETADLIFLSGFSTAAIVTNVSGRGVGMDVVKTNIEKIGGTVEVDSRPGRGCTVRMKIPPILPVGRESEVIKEDTKNAVAKAADPAKRATAGTSGCLKAAQARSMMSICSYDLAAHFKNLDTIRKAITGGPL